MLYQNMDQTEILQVREKPFSISLVDKSFNTVRPKFYTALDLILTKAEFIPMDPTLNNQQILKLMDVQYIFYVSSLDFEMCTFSY